MGFCRRCMPEVIVELGGSPCWEVSLPAPKRCWPPPSSLWSSGECKVQSAGWVRSVGHRWRKRRRIIQSHRPSLLILKFIIGSKYIFSNCQMCFFYLFKGIFSSAQVLRNYSFKAVLTLKCKHFHRMFSNGFSKASCSSLTSWNIINISGHTCLLVLLVRDITVYLSYLVQVHFCPASNTAL